MKLLVVGPVVYKWGANAYGGVERLCALLVEGLARKGHQVVAVAPVGSKLPSGVTQMLVSKEGGEAEAARVTREMVRPKDVDAVLDLTHEHLLRLGGGWPGLSWIWHDPYINIGSKFPKDGVMALSAWQQKRFQEKEQLPCGVVDVHMVADDYIWEDQPKTDAWLCLGRIDKAKGAVVAARAFLANGQRLLVVGPAMEQAEVEKLCALERQSLRRVHWLGELPEAEKMRLLHTSKAIWYWPEWGPGLSEAHSMKTVEALCCGLPVLIRDLEPYPEVFGDLVSYMSDPSAPLSRLEAQPGAELSQRARAIWGMDATTDRVLAALKGME